MGDEKDLKSDLIDYVNQNGHDNFSDLDFNDSDALVLAELSYIRWDEWLSEKDYNEIRDKLKNNQEISLKDIIFKLDSEMIIKRKDERYYRFLLAVGDTNRFGDMKIGYFSTSNIEKKDVSDVTQIEQFAALTISFTNKLGEKVNYISYRGTDGTLEGWCEDFNMAYDSMTEAQRKSVEYLENVIGKLDGKIYLGGHSKGGNDAMYAFLFGSDLSRSRIERVYTFDGPGMTKDIMYVDENGVVYKLNPKINKELMQKLIAIGPYDSIIGQLLREYDYQFVDTREGMLLDHDALTWLLKLDPNTKKFNGDFKQREQSFLSKYINEIVDDFVFQLPDKYKKNFMNVVWEWIYDISNESDESDESGGFNEFLDKIKNPESKAWNSFIEYFKTEVHLDQKFKFFETLFCIAGFAILDLAKTVMMDNINQLLDEFKKILKERNIDSFESLWMYLKEDPFNNTMSLLKDIFFNKTIIKAVAGTVVGAVLLKLTEVFIVILLKTVVNFLVAHVVEIAAIFAVLVVCGIVIKYIKEHWDEIVNAIKAFGDFVMEKISEFANEIKSLVLRTANRVIAEIAYKIKQIFEFAQKLDNQIIEAISLFAHYTSVSIKTALKIAHPFIYSALRLVSGYKQQQVQVDMARLQDAVDHMDKLAGRVKRMDGRLSNLYRSLSANNIEKEKGVFTSLANMYHLTRADISVDEGDRIRRKANAIKSVFDGYKDVEKWLARQIGV